MGQSGSIVVAGGSGFLGTSLGGHLAARGWRVVVLSRRASGAEVAGVSRVPWDARTEGPWISALDGAAALVNLTGRSVDCIKTPDHRDEIVRSRVESTLALGRAVSAAKVPPPVWVQMSTAHIYGDPPTTVCDEDSPTGEGLAPFVGRAWERAFDQACPAGVRRVIMRTGFVIGRRNAGGAGALGKLGLLARLGLGGRVGAGTQGMSWIHERDFNRFVEWSITNPATHGTFVISGPNPVPQVEFMRALRRAVRMPIGLPAPRFMVRLGAALVMRTDPELALYGRYVVSKRLAVEGFAFEFPMLDEALREIYRRE